MARRHLTRDEMMRAVGLLEGGVSQVNVARALGTSQSVISRLNARYQEHADVSERHRGRGRITTPVEDRFLQFNARRRRDITAPELQLMLQNVHQVTVSADTVRRRLHEANLHSRRPLRVPSLTRGNREARYFWAQEHVLWQEEQWSTVLFSDESRLGIYPDSRRTRMWREPGNINRLRHVQEVRNYQGGTIMVWGGISVGGRTDLVLVEPSLTGAVYRDLVLQPIVVPYAAAVGPQFLFMQDNARPHVSRTAMAYLQDQAIEVLPWPAQSPDLNPIEHVWDMLKRNILRMGRERINRQELFVVASQAWNAIPQDDINNLILRMPHRCQAVINNRGGHTTY